MSKEAKDVKDCNRCRDVKNLDDFHKNGKSRDGLSYICKICDKHKYYDWYSKNKKYKKDYYLQNKKHFTEYYKNRYHTNPIYKLIFNLRRRLYQAMQNNSKSGHTLELLDCDINFLNLWLRYQCYHDNLPYTPELYHLDHIKPLTSYDLSKPEQQYEANN